MLDTRLFLMRSSAHRDAWEKAGVLHRDVSYNNILIYDTKDNEGEEIRLGFLADWELSKYKEYMNTGLGPRQPDRTVCSVSLRNTRICSRFRSGDVVL